jgi:hypothetical protein
MNDLRFPSRLLPDNARFSAELNLRGTSNVGSKKSFEFFRSISGVFGDLSHGERMNRVVPRNDEDSHAVAHYGVLSFPNHLKPRLLEGTNGGAIANAREFGHICSNDHDLTRNFGSEARWQFCASLKVFANSVANILQCFLPGGSLAATAGKIVAPYRKSFFGFHQRYRVLHPFRLGFPHFLSSY